MYTRFGAMIATSMVAMFLLTYINTYAEDHIDFSETRAYMTLIMGATMAVIMLAYMWKMMDNLRANVAIIGGSLLLFALGTFLVRSQVTVEDSSYMRAMIPHHSIAILTSEHATIRDIRVCELAVDIIEAQRREIDEMQWLIDDIAENGPATTREDAEARPVPRSGGAAIRDCG
jgi:uncharacterized protein (DUF305 family)